MLSRYYTKHLKFFLILILLLGVVGCVPYIREPTPQGPDDEVVELVRQFNQMTHMGPKASPFTAWKPVKALGDSGDPRAVEPLIIILEETKYGPVERSHAALGLVKLGDRRAIDPLRRMLKDPWIAGSAVCGLAELGDSGAVPYLLDVLEEGHWKSKTYIAWGLRFFEDPRIVNALIDSLNDQQLEVRFSAADSLGELNNPKAIDPLIDLLDDNHWRVRWTAAKSLGNLKDSRAVESLIGAIKSEWGNRYKIRTGRFIRGGITFDALQPSSCKYTPRAYHYLIGGDGCAFMMEKYALRNIIDHNAGNAKEQLLDLCKNGDDLATAAAYDILISIGEKGTEPMLIQSLQSHGDTTMAYDFITCGNGKLEMAGAEWIEKNRWKNTVIEVLGDILLRTGKETMYQTQGKSLRSHTSMTDSQIRAEQDFLKKQIESSKSHTSRTTSQINVEPEFTKQSRYVDPKQTQFLLHPIWGELR